MKKIMLFIISLFLLFSCSWEEEVITNTENPSIEKEIIVLWDSLVAGYNLDISESYPMQLEDILRKNWYNYKITNAWVSWNTSKNLLDRIELYDEVNADIYIITIWGNDWLRRQSIEDMKLNIKKTINHLQNINSDSKIVLTWMQIPINLWLNYSIDFKNTFEEIADELDIYLYDFLLEWVAKDVKLNLNDWIHPNKDWYEVIANNLYKFLIDKKIITK